MKAEWTRPEVEEIDIAERTQSGDGTVFDGLDPSFDGSGGGGEGGGGGEPTS